MISLPSFPPVTRRATAPLLCALLGPIAGAQGTFAETDKLLASDGDDSDDFGNAVAIATNFAVCGAPRDNHPGLSDAGAAHVYRRGTAGWTHEARLEASDKNASDFFGFAVAASDAALGEVAVVGAYQDDVIFCCDKGGSAYVFRELGGAWIEEQKLVASDVGQNDFFGAVVDVSNDVIVVGAQSHDHLGSNSGAAYVFRDSGAGWVEEAELLASDGSAFYSFGSDVAVSGDVVVVGSQGHPALGNSAGSAYVFRWNGLAWVEEQQLFGSQTSVSDEFGQSVAISGDVIVIGSPFDDNPSFDSTGSLYVFRWNGAAWVEEARLLAGDGEDSDLLGWSADVSGDVVVGGAYGVDLATESSAGAAYTWRWNGTGWGEEQKLTASDAAQGDDLGFAVAVSGDSVLVGSPEDDDLGSGSGSAYVYGDCQGLASLNVPVTASLQAVCASGSTDHGIGDLAVTTGPGSQIAAELTFASGFEHLDGCYDFRWVSVETDYAAAGVSLGADPLLGPLPALDPQAAGAGCSLDGNPYYYSDAEWAAGTSCATGQTIHVEGLSSRFVAQPSDAAAAAVVREFRTFLVVQDAGGGLPAQSLCVLDGFAWRYDSATGASTICGALAPDAGFVTTALANATAPGFPGWSATDACELFSACGALRTDVDQISVSAGGTQSFTLDGGPDCGSHFYLILGTVSGTVPGLSVGGVTIPLNQDVYFTRTVVSPNLAPLQNTFGTLSAAGEATAAFDLPGGVVPALAGITAHHAAVLIDPQVATLDFASGAVSLEFIP